MFDFITFKQLIDILLDELHIELYAYDVDDRRDYYAGGRW
jgi:hypothetical protein